MLDGKLIQRIHDTEGRFVLAIAGGGASAIAELLAVPGASRTIIEASVPYDPASLADYIGGVPDQAASGKTARAMAMAAFQRAFRLNGGPNGIFGVGCSAALTTDRNRRGTDRAYIALHSIDETRELELTLSRDDRDRASQESACAGHLIAAMADVLDIDTDSPSRRPGETLEIKRQEAHPEWKALFSGHLAFTNHDRDATGLIFPGAFNPIHDGHREMMRVAGDLTGAIPLLEISTFNVDKPPLDYIEMQARHEALAGLSYTFTNAPTFLDKTNVFQKSTFMVGADTLERIGQPKYYDDSIEKRDRAITLMRERGIRFLVFGRERENTFVTLSDLDIPDALRSLCDAVSESDFRFDISSSAIRNG